MKVNEVEFAGSFPDLASAPDLGLPAVAFIGRSNVGKSSFINHLLARKNVAKTSGTPGKTQTLNFFAVNKKIAFVDLPGYGFAKVPKAVKESWVERMAEFLWNYERLAVIVQLVDIRHKPSKEDLEFNAIFTQSSAELRVIANKSDKLKKSQIPGRLAEIRKELGLESPPLAHSVKDGKSRGSAWLEIEKITHS